MDDAVTAFLADVRMQAEDHHLVPAAMVLPLVAALEDALKLADDWGNEAVRLDAVVARSAPGGQRATLASGRAQAHKDCADALFGTITSALTGEETG